MVNIPQLLEGPIYKYILVAFGWIKSKLYFVVEQPAGLRMDSSINLMLAIIVNVVGMHLVG